MTGPVLERTAVGLRDLPHIKHQYYARTPKNNAFKTVWLPVNASKRIIVDRKQDMLHLYYSRHLQACEAKKSTDSEMLVRGSKPKMDIGRPSNYRPTTTPATVRAAMWMTNANSLAPFASLGKPTCGYFFSRETDNMKRRTGIPPTNTVKWRSHSAN